MQSRNIKKYSIIIFLLVLSPLLSTSQEIGPPGLSVGADEVLFKKGLLDVELIGQIISEKQDEVKKEIAKRIILNKRLTDGPYLTYNYAESVLNSLLEHKDKNVIKKALLEHSTELAVVLGISESYLRIKRREIIRLELTYLKWSKQEDQINAYFEELGFTGEKDFYLKDDEASKKFTDQLNYSPSQILQQSTQIKTHTYERKPDNINYTYDKSAAQRKGKYLPKISLLYNLKRLNGNKNFPLQYILTDMFLELSRKNEVLQQSGFFQKVFDDTAFQNTSKYRKFLVLESTDETYKMLVKRLKSLYQSADEIIKTNLKYADLILNLPADPTTTTLSSGKINTQIIDIYTSFLALNLGTEKFNDLDQKIIQNATNLIYYSISAFRSNDPKKFYPQILYEIKKITPSLIRLSLKTNDLKELVKSLDLLYKTIQTYQSIQMLSELKQVVDDLNWKDIQTNFAELFSVVTNLDKAQSYDQVSKLIIDVGQLFPKIYDTRIMNDIANLQEYLIVNTDSNSVDIRVEDMIGILYDKFAKHSSQTVSLHFTVGYNYLSSIDQERFGDLSYAAEKIGVRIKLYDLYKQRVFKSRFYKRKQDPILNHVFVLAYGSGLLYQIDALKTDDEFEQPSFGGALGFHFFNGLDLTFGGTSIYFNDSRETVFNIGVEIPIVEYIARLGSKTKKQGNE